MKMKRILRWIFFAAILIANSVWSDQGARTEKLEEAKERLNLTEEQIVSIRPILEEDLAQKNKVLLKYGIDLESGKRPEGRMKFREARALGNDLDAVREETVEKLSVFLSDEQIEEYKTIQNENKAKIRERIRKSR